LVGVPVGEGKSSSAWQPEANFQLEEHGVMEVADVQVGRFL
jgi:hypothetical protein